MSFVSVRGLHHQYGDQIVLERINLEVERKSFCTIVGLSGCGKSTFLRLLLSQEGATKGEILIDGAPIQPEPGPDRGIVYQRYSVFPHLTVHENLIFSAEMDRAPLTGRLFGRARRHALEEVSGMLESVGLAHAKDHYPKALSGGMQQRLAIAQALLRRPKVLLLDEPFGALDPGTRTRMQDLMLNLWRRFEMTVFMVTHDLQEGFRLGTRLLVFDKVRWDQQAPGRYGATITYDLPIESAEQAEAALPDDIGGVLIAEQGGNADVAI